MQADAWPTETALTRGGRSGPPLPLSKLGGASPATRVALKGRRITTADRLLLAAGPAERREALALEADIDPRELLALARRAEMARVNGVGVVFGMMLEEVGVRDLRTLAAADPSVLHDRLRRLNAEERLARRAPTPDEVASWVRQARGLPPRVEA